MANTHPQPKSFAQIFACMLLTAYHRGSTLVMKMKYS